MKRILPFLTAIILTATACGPNIYKAADFNNRTASHKIVAILPAKTIISLRPNEVKRMTREQIKENEEKTGFSVQDRMYSWFLRRSDRFNYTVTFQDISKTNALLKQNGISYADLDGKSQEELAKLLGVDAVISTRVSMMKPISEGAALALGIAFGGWGTTNEVQTSININDGKTGDLVWKFDFTASGSVGSSTDRLVNQLMQKASKKFPYNRK